MSTPLGRRQALEALPSRGMSEHAACRYLGLSRRVTGYELKQPVKDKSLGERLIESSQQLPRFEYRKTALLLDESLCRVKRLWKQLGQLPRRRPRRRRRYAAAWGNAPEQRLVL
jgi:putative transposase